MTSRNRLLPEFEAWRTALPSALVDRAEIVVGDWPIIGRAETVTRTLNALPEIHAMTFDGEVVPVFGALKQYRGGTIVDVKVSSGPSGNVTYPTIPVFQGRLKHAFGLDRLGTTLRGEHVRLGLEATLNLPRFLTAQRIPRFFGIRGNQTVVPNATAISQQYAQYRDEYCLTDDTNVLLGGNALYRYALSKPVEDHLLDYISTVQSFLGHEMQETAHAYGDRLEHVPYYSVRAIEFVWEFSHKTPIRFVEEFELPMRTLGERTSRHRALVRGEEVRTVQNSFCVRSELSAGCSLALYAKTNKRIRFEIRMDDYCIGRALRTGKTCRSLGHLRANLAALRVWATERFILALNDLERSAIPPISSMTSVQFCAEVGRLLNDEILAHTVLETMRNRGSIASPQSSPLREAVQILSNAGVLKRIAARKPVFVPQDRWISAVSSLRQM